MYSSKFSLAVRVQVPTNCSTMMVKMKMLQGPVSAADSRERLTHRVINYIFEPAGQTRALFWAIQSRAGAAVAMETSGLGGVSLKSDFHDVFDRSEFIPGQR